uniref:Mediator of RNA polymerase II transcription subunit 1 n=1 Tax=Neogobius melanostomus TaxID=47308 RepID=A0A8C6UIS1_9GOBI
MGKSRDESIPCEPLRRTMLRLQEVFNVSSINAMQTRLETIATQHGLGFHLTEGICYLTADLFYLEVVLLPCGGVDVVNVAPHGGALVASASFLELLRSKDFVRFSNKLGDLYRQYNIPGDNEIKLKLLEAVQALGKDLEQMSHVLRTSDDPASQADLINNGIVGSVTSGKEGGPLTVQFYVSQDSSLKTMSPEGCPCPAPETLVHTALLTVALTDVPHRLQVASSITQPPQLDEQGYPLFKSVNEVSCDQVPACFLLKLQPAVAMMPTLWSKLSQITDVSIADVDLQWAPLPRLLTSNHCGGTPDDQDIISTVSVAEGGMHTYVFPIEAWEGPSHQCTLVDTVSFTHLSHVPALLELLRHQCDINSVLKSALTSKCAVASPSCELHFEVLPETDTSFTVTFHPPDTDSLAVLVVDIPGSRQVTCRLYGAGLNDSTMEECLSNVIKRSHSLPVTLQTLHTKLSAITSSLVSPTLPVATETDSDHSAASPSPGSAMDTHGASTTFSQSAPVPEGHCAASASACYAAVSVSQSELLPEINPDTPDGP